MDIEELYEALPPMQDKDAIYCPGRFQPMTAGHFKVFNKMKKYIREHPALKLTPIIVIVEGEKSSLDKQKNPLTGEERKKFLEASGKVNGFKILIAKNAIQAAGVCRDNGYEPKIVAAGSDRAEMYLKGLDKYFKTPEDEPIDHIALPGLDRTDDAVATKKGEKAKALDDAIDKMSKKKDLDDDEISASLARHAAELGYLEEFTKITGLEHKPDLAKKMYDKVRSAMGVEE